MSTALADLARLLAEIAVDDYCAEMAAPAANDDHHQQEENDDR